MYKSKHRDASLAGQIYLVCRYYLGDDSIGVIMCGGAGKSDFKDYEGSDVDYVVVVSELLPNIILAGANIQVYLRKQYKAKLSQTMITADELANVRTRYLEMDGKAIQAIIEARPEDLAGLSIRQIPKLSSAEIKKFSRANFPILQALLRKTVVRANPRLSKASKVSMAKIALIVQKMHKQSQGGRQYRQRWSGRNQLQDLKILPHTYNDSETRNLLMDYLNLHLK